jgi:hypothetical protein
MGLLLVFHPLLRRVYEFIQPISSSQSRSSNRSSGASSPYRSAAEAESRMNQRATFDFGFAFVFLAALHGFSALKVLAILYANFNLATRLPKKYIPAATWIFNIGILFANELSNGYKYERMAEIFFGASRQDDGSGLHNWGTWLDDHGGIMKRWEIQFNLTVLRLISFNLDYFWSLDKRGGSPMEVSQYHL